MKSPDHQDRSFFGIPDEVMDDERLEAEEFRIYAHLSCCVGKGTEPSVATIAKTCLIPEGVVRKSLDRLDALGWLSHFSDLDLVRRGWR